LYEQRTIGVNVYTHEGMNVVLSLIPCGTWVPHFLYVWFCLLAGVRQLFLFGELWPWLTVHYVLNSSGRSNCLVSLSKATTFSFV